MFMQCDVSSSTSIRRVSIVVRIDLFKKNKAGVVTMLAYKW